MTAHRNRKAAIRRFMAEHHVSYMEARRLMGFEEITHEFMDARGLPVEVRIRQNRFEVRWSLPEGGEDIRETHLSRLFDVYIWPEATNPAFKPDGRIEGYGGSFLEVATVDRIRTWVAGRVKSPRTLSVDDTDFITQLAKPKDWLYTVVDMHALTASMHVVRMPVVPPASREPLAVMAWFETNSAAADELFDRSVAVDWSDRDRFSLLASATYCGVTVAEAIALHQRYAAEGGGPVGKLDLKSLAWTAVEHHELLEMAV